MRSQSQEECHAVQSVFGATGGGDRPLSRQRADDGAGAEELIQLAKDIRAARLRGEETGLTEEEIAFYDALAENESAREAMGEPALRVIAHELVVVIKGNITTDWTHRDSARAKYPAAS